MYNFTNLFEDEGQGIARDDVPRIFELYNDAVMYGDVEAARTLYRIERHDIDICNDCGKCTAACGFKIPIPEHLKKARELLAD